MLAFVWCAFVCAVPVRAQYGTSHAVTDGHTPPFMAGGSPAGSYALSGFDTINMYNGNLNFALPLLGVGGHGDAGYTMMLQIERRWVVKTERNYTGPGNHTSAYVIDKPHSNPWEGLAAGYGPGVLQGRRWRDRHPDPSICIGCSQAQCSTVTRLTFIQPDGTEYELRDVQTDGRPNLNAYSGPGFSRGNLFATKDGSSATFVADAAVTDVACSDTSFMAMHGPNLVSPSGYLMLRNGVRYRIDNGLVTWVRDRNGNHVSFQNLGTNGKVTQVTDSLGRVIAIDYSCGGTGQCDTITYKGFGEADRTIKVWYGAMSQSLRPGYTGKSELELFPLNGSNPNGTFDARVVSSVELPDGRRYHFKYNDYGELARVELPTGGAYEYDWAGGRTDTNSPGLYGGNGDYRVYRGVKERRVYGGGNTLERKTVYTPYSHGTSDLRVAEVAYSGAGARLAHTDHYFYYHPLHSIYDTSVYPHWSWGREYRTDMFDDADALIRRLDFTWEQRAPVSWVVSGNHPVNDPRVTQALNTLVDGNLVSKETFSYDDFNNQTDSYEYDYGAGAPGAFLRRTHTDYVTNPSYVGVSVGPSSGASLRALPLRQWVSTDLAGSNKVALTDYAYDQFAPDDCPLIVGHDSGYGAGFNTRGNLTGVTRYADAAGGAGAVSISSHFDIAGNAVSATDANGNTSYVSYADNFSDGVPRHTYAYPTATTTAAPNPTPVPDPAGGPTFAAGAFGSTAGLTSQRAYDFRTGRVTRATDANGQATTYDYADPLDRLRRVELPDGGRTTYTYIDAHQCGAYVESRTLLDASGRESASRQFIDGLGRPYLTESTDEQDPANPYLRVDTRYDAMGRVSKVSNPYRTSGCTAPANPSGRWTEAAYDALGRVRAVTTPDGATFHTLYDGARTMVTDQARKQRISKADALGRLTEVWEVRSPDQATGTEAVSFPVPQGLASAIPAVSAGYKTGYTYDVLGNLRKVEQGGQHRFFMYDSLGRLTRARNPEQATHSPLAVADPVTQNGQWSLAYAYDANGNLSGRTDARDVTTRYTYDGLNRNIITHYEGGGTSTPDAYRHYDNPAAGKNGRGRFWWSNTGAAASAVATGVNGYDELGRVLEQHQNFVAGGGDYSVRVEYNLAGGITRQTYPSGHTVSYNYDAAGRVGDGGALFSQLAFTGDLGDGVARVYAAGVRYSEFGGVREQRFGTQTPLYHKLHYNLRGQLFDIRLSTVGWAADEWNWNRGAVINYYSSNYAWEGNASTPPGPDNNGNVMRQQHWVPADDAVSSYTYTQDTFGYDALNRLTSISEAHGTPSSHGGQDFAQTYAYDRWGNRTVSPATTDGLPEPQFAVEASTNRLGVRRGIAGGWITTRRGI